MMQPLEYDRMAALESEHWWYRGFRGLIRCLLKRAKHTLPAEPAVLDAGCGTGENLQLLRDELQPGSLYGFDVSEVAVAHARRKTPGVDIYVSDLCRPEMPGSPLDVVLCADVIYMTGLDAALPGLRTIVSQLRSGGLLLLHVPAYNWLYSRHDVAVETRQRFTTRDIRALLMELDLSCELLTYRMCVLFPLVLAARLPSLLLGVLVRKPLTSRSDLALPPRWINAALATIVGWENRGIAAGLRWPWGSSIIAVGRKP